MRDKAIATYKLAIEADPRMLTARQSLGAIYVEAGMFDDAITEYRQAIALAPDRANQAYNNLAWLYAQQGTNLDEAMTFAEKARELSPGDGDILDTLGLIYYLKQDYSKALINLESARVSLPSNPTIRYHLGMAYHKSNSPEKARGELQKALEIDRNFSEADKARQILEELGG
jgi:tetratricopeptide (TPR) repeat protein